MRQRTWMAVGVLGVMLAGCSSNPAGMVMSGGKTAYKVIAGAEAEVRPLQEFSTGVMAAYKELRLGEVTSDVPAIVPATEVAIVRIEMGKEFGSDQARKRFPGGGKALVADVVCRFLKERGTFGGEGRLDMIVTLVDGESKAEIGRLFIEGLSESPVAGKTDDMAKENAKELIQYLAKRQEGKSS